MIRPEDRQKYLQSIQGRAHFRLQAYPNEEPKELVAGATELKELLERTRFHRHGEPFPRYSHDTGCLELAESYIEGYFQGRRSDSIFRLYRSGQFVNLATLEEDFSEVRIQLEQRLEVNQGLKEQLDGYLDTVWVVDRLVTYMACIDRLGSQLGVKTEWKIDIGLVNPGVRALSVMDPSRSIWNLYKVTDDVMVSQVVPFERLNGATGEVVCDYALALYERFGFKSTRENIFGMISQMM